MEKENLKILLVDDHMVMRGVLRRYLTDAGVTKVSEAVNGEDALQKIAEAGEAGSAFNVIMADWNMPVMDGLELVKKIRADKNFSKVAFLMITAESEKSRVMEALQAGATAYLVKPFSQEEVQNQLQKIQEWLKARA